MDKNPGFFKKWLISIRPFALPASTMPVIFGAVLAATYGNYSFNTLLFILSLFGMIVLHSAANILSDVYDFKRGLDKEPNPVSGGVVRKIISLREARNASIILFSIGAAIGFLLVYLTGIWLLVIGIGGLLIGIFYTTETRVSLKYHGLGDLAVFLNFGILGSLGSWYVQSGELSWIPVIWVVPMSTLVIAILHANNWRDIVSDKSGKITTIAGILGDKISLAYYGFLVFGPFIMILSMIFLPRLFFDNLPVMPYTFLLTLLAFPLAIKLWRIAFRRHSSSTPIDFVTLDGTTAKLNLQFGLLCTFALLLNFLLIHFI
ncbi:MAG: 1,4-dihydroxy-2-naphthoate octaprenyltransferase [Bacteroidales bacterium]|nr:1,4-dihydroxy-2-naphthoate octaprenyltransferase [Bacteroidales bacterium]